MAIIFNNNFSMIRTKTVSIKPTMIIAHTVPGKDISFMECITECMEIAG
jgi:hypothetical protein